MPEAADTKADTKATPVAFKPKDKAKYAEALKAIGKGATRMQQLAIAEELRKQGGNAKDLLHAFARTPPPPARPTEKKPRGKSKRGPSAGDALIGRLPKLAKP